MKILYITTTGMTMAFFKSFVRTLLDEGHTVDIACNTQDSAVDECFRKWNCKTYHIPFSRSPLAAGNLKAIRELKKLVRESRYDIVHCHTPVAAACTRVACRGVRRQGTRVIYTAHGFHFYSGAPLKNWLMFYPVELLCSYWTDVLITINTEDFQRAKKKLHAKRTVYIPGVGIDLTTFGAEKFGTSGRCRAQCDIPQNAKLILSVGELNENKNHQTLFRALAQVGRDDVYCVICGEGDRRSALEQTARELGIDRRVLLPGRRDDVPRWMAEADLYVHPSLREGLSVSTMEAMASGLPVICGDIRGNRDLIQNGVGGFLVQATCPQQFASAIEKLLDDGALCRQMGERNMQNVRRFSRENVFAGLREIYGA